MARVSRRPTIEFDILEVLMRAAGRVLSRDTLMENLYNRKATPFDRSIDMHVSHLRKKLETDRTLFKTVRGVGIPVLSAATTKRRLRSQVARIIRGAWNL